MPQRGFTLLELLITLIILSLLVAWGIPSLQSQIRQTQTRTATLSLYEAIQTTRVRAVTRNGRATLRARGSWDQGWELFDDLNHNGERDPGEELILEHQTPESDIHIRGNSKVSRYISYIGTGESRHATGTPRGGFQAGTITICPESGNEGYKLVLARMGRVRQQVIDAEECFSG